LQATYDPPQPRTWSVYEFQNWSDWGNALKFSMVDTRVCPGCKCCQASCYCVELLCRRCMRCAADCECLEKWVEMRVCESCGELEEGINLYTCHFYAIHLDPNCHEMECKECGCRSFKWPSDLEADSMREFYTLDSADVCCVCLRVDAQDLIMPCAGQNCRAMLHETCMDGPLCRHCVQSGNVISEDEEESECDDSGS
jgi:hypothetical protein